MNVDGQMLYKLRRADLKKVGLFLALRISMMNQRFYLLAVIACCVFSAPAQSNSKYYCPKGGGILNVDALGMRGAAFSFARDSEQASDFDPNSPLRNWTVTDCSNQQFYCIDAKLSDAPTADAFRLFVPHVVTVYKSYEYGSARARSIGSTLRVGRPTIEFLIWQSTAQKGVPMKLTIQQGRGVIYIDGMNFWNPPEHGLGESCSLVSKQGLFPSTQVVPYPLGSPLR
jgi:hypothetical protein